MQEESTNRSYATILARLLCMVLRSLENSMNYTPLTAGQKALAEELRGALNDNNNDPSVERTREAIARGPFHALCVALFCCTSSDGGRSERELEKCPVYRFLVFASLRGSEHGGGFEPVSVVGQTCARLKFSIRLVVYHEIFQQRGNAPAVAGDSGRLFWGDKINQVEERLLTFVHENKYTPFAAIHSISLIAANVAKTSGSAEMPVLVWTRDTNRTSLSIGDTLVTLDGLRDFVRDLLREADEFLATVVLLGLRLPGMDKLLQLLQRLVDNHWSKDPGYSFLDDPRNKLGQYKHCLLQAFITSSSTEGKFIIASSSSSGGGSSSEYKKDACYDWLRKAGEFLSMLTVLIHIGGGQPARAQELATLQIRGTSDTHRGVYYTHGTVMLCTRYHKGRSIKGSDKVIPRFLPKSVASLLLKYLVIVRPLEV
jgi:hypothetical protein